MRPDRICALGLAGIALLAAACASTAATPTPSPATVSPAPAMHDPLAGPWSISRPAGSFENTIRLSSELVSRVDSVERVDSSAAVIRVSWTRLAGSQPARLSGLVSEYAVAAGAVEPVPISGLRLPLPFAATEGRGATQARLDVALSGACSLAAAAVQPARELYVSPPPALVVGTSWTDSSSYEICRDSVPLQVRSQRSFRVLGAERREAVGVVLVERASIVTMIGEGAQFGEPFKIAAEGAGVMRLELRLDDGSVLAASGEAELRMTMRGRRRSQDLTQRTRIEISSP